MSQCSFDLDNSTKLFDNNSRSFYFLKSMSNIWFHPWKWEFISFRCFSYRKYYDGNQYTTNKVISEFCVKKHRTCTKTFFRLLWFVEMVSYLIRWVGRSLRLWYFIIPQFKEWDLFSQFQQTHNHSVKRYERREQMKMKMFSHKLLICKCHHFCHHHLRKWFSKEVVLLPLLYCRFYSWFVDIITINKIL